MKIPALIIRPLFSNEEGGSYFEYVLLMALFAFGVYVAERFLSGHIDMAHNNLGYYIAAIAQLLWWW